ncbi:MAG: hypothetical protein Q9228_005438 [Teloschistes exilis]
MLRSLQYRISRPSARQRAYDNISVTHRASHKRTISAYLTPENPEHGILAWLCRGEIGRYELQEILDDSALLWTFLFNSRLTVDKKGDILLVLFENGCNLADIVRHDGESATAFLWYLRQADSHEQALRVAQHFQRITEDDTCLPERKYFLTGRVSVLSTSEDVNELKEGTTTALHEAVKAGNYALVIYLVEMRFDVKALDYWGELALELAIAKPSSASRNSIIALLTQNKGERMRERIGREMVPGRDAPLGWTEVRVSRIIRAWQETSVEGDFDAITFVRPKTGLYDSDRITLGRIQGQGQVYRLDPMRFLKVSGGKGVLSEYKPASKPRFDDEWYEKDARIIAEPLPFQPLSDDRAWIRYPAIGATTLFDLRSIFFVVFGVLSLCTRLTALQRLELPISVVAIGLFAWGTSNLETPLQILRLLDLRFEWQNQEYCLVLWNNVSVLLVSSPSETCSDTS